MQLAHDSSSSSLDTHLSLISRLRDPRNHSGWLYFYEAYWSLLFRFARRNGLNHAEAQDIAQETVIDVQRQISDLQLDPNRGGFKAWLLTIARRNVQDHFRKRQRQANAQENLEREMEMRGLLDDAAAEQAWAEEWEQNIAHNALEQLKQKVKPLQFQIFHLYVVKGLSLSAVSERLGASKAEIFWVKYRLSMMLRKIVREQEAKAECLEAVKAAKQMTKAHPTPPPAPPPEQTPEE